MFEVLSGQVRRRRAYRTMRDTEGEVLRNAEGEAFYAFDFELWCPLPGQDRNEKIHVNMYNHIADQCKDIKPGDKVRIQGSGLELRDADEDGIDRVAVVSEPSTVKIFPALPRPAGDSSTQVEHSSVPITIALRRRTRQSPQRPKPTEPVPKKRVRQSPQNGNNSKKYDRVSFISSDTVRLHS